MHRRPSGGSPAPFPRSCTALTLACAVLAMAPGTAQAISCQEILTLVDNDVPVETILAEIQRAPLAPTGEDLRCVSESDAPTAVKDAVRARVIGSVNPQAPSEPPERVIPPPATVSDEGADPPWARLLVNTSLTGMGVALAGGAVYNYVQAREAYADYLERTRPSVYEPILTSEVRPRATVAGMEAAGAVVLLGSSALLWTTTDRLERLSDGPTFARYAVDTAVTGAGACTLFASGFNLFQARKAYEDYLAEPDPATADAILEEVRFRQKAVAVEGVLGTLALGSGIYLFTTSGPFRLTAAPGHVGLGVRW